MGAFIRARVCLRGRRARPAGARKEGDDDPDTRPPLRLRHDCGCPVRQAIERTRAGLKEQGFGVLTEIDIAETLRDKLDADFRPYVILGACNPPLAHRALSADLGIGLLLPCNVVVYDNGDGTSTVEALDPEAALGIVGDNAAIAEVAREAKGRLQQALARLRSEADA